MPDGTYREVILLPLAARTGAGASPSFTLRVVGAVNQF